MIRRRLGEQHIGNARGLIAIWCDETEALDIAAHLPSSDTFRGEILEAVEKAYPKEVPDDST